MRPVEPVLGAEIADEIAQRVQRYGPGGGDEIAVSVTRLVIQQAVGYFIDHVADPDAPRVELDELLRRIGRGEAYSGRTLDSLREAFSIGAKLAWQRIHDLASSQGLDAKTLGGIGDELFEFMASLTSVSAEGYHEAMDQLSEVTQQWRSRLLELILDGRTDPHGEFGALVSAGGWQVPERVAMLAVDVVGEAPLPAVRLLPPYTLARLGADHPAVLLRAPLSPTVLRELEVLFAGHRLAIGCEVDLADARTSLRWARRAVQLAREGVIVDEGIIDCNEHIGTLWIHSEPMLADIINHTVLAPLYAETPHSKKILGETLLMWIETNRGSAPVVAEMLGKHPQTIRYRMRRLREVLGDLLDDPNRVMEMYYALRSSGPLWNDGKPAPPPPVMIRTDEERTEATEPARTGGFGTD